MDLVVLGILLCITVSTVQGVTPKCCVATTKKFPLALLRKVNKYEVQTSSGLCEIDALVLHVRKRKYCASPGVERVLKTIRKIKAQNSPQF